MLPPGTPLVSRALSGTENRVPTGRRFPVAALAVLLAILTPFALAVLGPSRKQEAEKRRSPDGKLKRKVPRSAVEEGTADPGEPCPGSRRKTGEATFRQYVVRTYREPNPAGCFEIRRGGRRVHSAIGALFQIGGSPMFSDEPSQLVRIGTDVTGAGKPDLVIGEFTGGAHCCLKIHVFEIGAGFREIAHLDLGHSVEAQFADVDGDGRMEIVAEDWSFADWHASFADSPAPQVILRFRDGAFRLVPELMRKPPPPAAELEARAQQVRNSRAWENPQDPPSDLWREMLDLIFSGNALEAWKFFEAAWPPGRGGKAEFLQEFRAQLAKSPHWTEVQALSSDARP